LLLVERFIHQVGLTTEYLLVTALWPYPVALFQLTFLSLLAVAAVAETQAQELALVDFFIIHHNPLTLLTM
jgi:hypothetical protein